MGCVNNSQEAVYRKYKDGDEERIIELFKLAFKKEYTPSAWHWSIKENPQADIYIILAFYKSELIGQSAGAPLSFYQDNKAIRALRIQNVMVHPDFRRKGIFLETMRQLEDLARKKGIDLLITFPNDDRHTFSAFTERLGYRSASDFSVFNLPSELLRNASNNGLTVDISEGGKFEQADLGFINSHLQGFSFFNIRNSDYLNWRYNKNSGRSYHIVRVFDARRQMGLAVCKFYADTKAVDLAEFFFDPVPEAIILALNKVADYYGKHNVASFNVCSAEHYPFHRDLTSMGFRKTPMLTHVVYKALSSKCPGLSGNVASYYLSMGDSDVY